MAPSAGKTGWVIVALGLVLALGGRAAVGVVTLGMGAKHYERQVTFELTFANEDLIWLGDPASPSASLYPKPGAMPIATDVCVTTRIEDRTAPARRHFREARIVEADGRRTVLAFTRQGEKSIGTIDADGRFAPNAFYKDKNDFLPSWPRDASTLRYDEEENALYVEIDLPGPVVSESLEFLPLALTSARGMPAGGTFSIRYTPATGDGMYRKPGTVELLRHGGRGKPLALAKGETPAVFRAGDARIGSFDNRLGTYLTEAVYRPGGEAPDGARPSVTVRVPGEFTWVVNVRAEKLLFTGGAAVRKDDTQTGPTQIKIDGNFDDWRNIAGIRDPRGDMVPYLEYVPDVDLLEFKVAHDARHIYLYARVAGQIGRSHPAGGRSYFYVYMDVDRNAETGFVPSRDDDCYFGVDLGDDCEVQFEFVDNAFRKSFYGFCGLGGEANVLKQQVTLGKSQYGKLDAKGAQRPNYKVEYVFRDGKTAITEDLKEGSSDSITVALSPDGSEVEVASTFEGFLKDPKGQPVVQLGQLIDLAVGMECDSKAYPHKERWAADSTAAIRGYTLSPEPARTVAIKNARE